MSYLISVPQTLASAATDVESIGSAIGTAGSNAAAPTTGVLAAAQDEVSGAIANLFGAYGREYQALLGQAAWRITWLWSAWPIDLQMQLLDNLQ